MDAPKKRTKALAGIYLTVILLLIYLPVIVVIAFSFNTQPKGLMWTGFTTEWYGKLFSNRQIMESFGKSLEVAAYSCAIAAVIGTLGAVALTRSKSKSDALVEGVSTLPIMVPEIIIGLSLMTVFSLAGIRSGTLALVLSHATFCIPYVLLNVKARLAGLDVSYEEAARDLGAGPLRAFFTIIMPLIAPAILSGVLLAFAMSLDDVVISYYMSGPDSTTFPVYVFSKLKTDLPPTINAMSTVLLGVTFVTVAVSRLIKPNEKKEEPQS